MSHQNSKIIIIGTYFGTWPVWFPAFFLSCAENQTINWLFFTDCRIPKETYPNIQFEQMSLAQFNDLASSKLDLPIQKGFYSQADLQPAYGIIFEDFIKDSDFWGHCDIDLVWGNIRSFITEEILQNFDIVSCRKDFLAGHLTLWRNAPEINTLFKAITAYREIFTCSLYHNFDECIVSTFLRTLIATGNSKIKVYWSEQMVTWFHGSTTPIGWYWDNGRIFDAKHREYIYLHFQHWKKSVTSIDFQVGDQPSRFQFTRRGIRSRRVVIRDLAREKFYWEDLKRLISHIFDGFQKLLRLWKRLIFIRNIYWAKRLALNSISARDFRYIPRTGSLYLISLDLNIGKQQQFFLESYYAALQLVDQRGAQFYKDDQERMFVEIGETRITIQCAEDIAHLKELYVDGIYNFLFSRPVVVLDIGMNIGLASIYLASQSSDAVVIGYEPCQKAYQQTLYNISLNPALSDKICAIRASVGDVEFKTIAHHFPQMKKKGSFLAPSGEDNRMGPRFEYEEVNIEDIAEILDSIVIDYPEHEIIVKIDYQHPEYHIDGVGEDHLVTRIVTAGKIGLVDAIMLKWHRPRLEHYPPVIAQQLSEYGFKVFLFSPYNAYEGSLYAVRSNPKENKAGSKYYEEKNT